MEKVSKHLWLRSEEKPSERRSPLSANDAAILIADGWAITVEQSPHRIFAIEEFSKVGCEVVSEGAWINAPENAFILGLKEIYNLLYVGKHNHIYFSHTFKQQVGWKNILKSFSAGKALYDLEYLIDDSGKRVAAFGYWAGFAAAALAVITLANNKMKNGCSSPVREYANRSQLLADVVTASRILPADIKILIIGARGRCGQGAVAILNEIGIRPTQWDIEHTLQGGPFDQIMDFDVVINCILLQKPTAPFLTRSQLEGYPDRSLSLICDVSCDPHSAYNPLPLYKVCTTFESPTLRLIDSGYPLDLIAIDHLPSLLPLESSTDFSAQLLPYLLTLGSPDVGVWSRAKELFQHHKLLAEEI